MECYTRSALLLLLLLLLLLKEELERPQKQQIIVPLDVDETYYWHNSFVLVPKANGEVRLCLDLARLNKVLPRPIYKGPTPNAILLRPAGFKYLMLIDTITGYHD